MIEDEALVLERMQRGTPLTKMYATSGVLWFCGGRVRDDVAERIAARADVRRGRGCETYRLKEHSHASR
jgi:hypothetical protein